MRSFKIARGSVIQFILAKARVRFSFIARP
jgi:hypothetical protein